jgi:nitronate monooxygenase
MSKLKNALPWTKSPLIVNAPMAGFAGGALASAVTFAGGLGLIGSAVDMDALRNEIRIASDLIASKFRAFSSSTLPVGVGFLPFIAKIEQALPIVAEFKPVVVWLFAANNLDQYAEWATAMRNASPETMIWIQVGSVAAALHVAGTAKPDVLCVQGADAGGHGFEKGAGIISLLPEVSDALARKGFSHLPLVASGGIVDGRGVAAALVLGAQGVVMGTRFLAASEVVVHPMHQAAVLEAKDGGQVTTRSKLFDELRGPSMWPKEYDGRSLMIQSHKDFVDGVSIEIIQQLHKEALEADDKGYGPNLQGRAAIWAGTGVGLVNTVESAETIVRRAREEATELLSKAAKL